MNKGTRILVLDDDADIGTMIKMMLEYKGYEVTVSDRAELAEEAMNNNDIDLVIMDMLLSGVNGTDLCTEMKKNAATSHIPIIMISAHPNAKEICLGAGADEFISKPFDMNDILSKIDHLINKHIPHKRN
ncbi:MAG TPA: response regulator transcription factor [Chitinophagaceae bacterium]|jgi:DNA-binding response OmpR family regulator|nr:response regulator transcription factor [Chitinophagaceae bacterium]